MCSVSAGGGSCWYKGGIWGHWLTLIYTVMMTVTMAVFNDSNDDGEIIHQKMMVTMAMLAAAR